MILGVVEGLEMAPQIDPKIWVFWDLILGIFADFN